MMKKSISLTAILAIVFIAITFPKSYGREAKDPDNLIVNYYSPDSLTFFHSLDSALCKKGYANKKKHPVIRIEVINDSDSAAEIKPLDHDRLDFEIFFDIVSTNEAEYPNILLYSDRFYQIPEQITESTGGYIGPIILPMEFGKWIHTEATTPKKKLRGQWEGSTGSLQLFKK